MLCYTDNKSVNTVVLADDHLLSKQTQKGEIMPDVFQPVDNENATDRNPYDNLSPKADASINTFEKDPDDSVDITAEYDDTKAQAIENELQ
jgi:hypothetical protein